MSIKQHLINLPKNLKKFFKSKQGIPYILTIAFLCILFVLFRMKGIEQDYLKSDYVKKIESATIKAKELKADRAKLLSAPNLREMARRHKMIEPNEKQVIVIP